MEKQTLKLIPPTDPRVQSAIAPFNDEMLKEHGYKNRQELSDDLFETMNKYGGIGLSANQVGLPYNVFVMGGHASIENGLKMTCFNPMIVTASEEVVAMKEGCLTFPFVWLTISRPRKVVAKYTDEKGDLQEAHLDGMMSRICQHEYDHILGRNFVEHVSKFKLKRAEEKAKKMFDKMKRYNEQKTK